MTENPHDLIAAQARIAAARGKLYGTLGDVQQRLRPGNLAQEAVDSAAQGVVSIARKGANAVRTRPVVTAAVVGGIALFLARGWIGRIVRDRNETPAPPTGLKRKAAKGTSA